MAVEMQLDFYQSYPAAYSLPDGTPRYVNLNPLRVIRVAAAPFSALVMQGHDAQRLLLDLDLKTEDLAGAASLYGECLRALVECADSTALVPHDAPTRDELEPVEDLFEYPKLGAETVKKLREAFAEKVLTCEVMLLMPVGHPGRV